ncbi:MAG: formate dehydrogenase accessory sulfurtransferase FdhD [Candidatus Eisenbacteria bacterium]|nr:formate dehydrogenase accessory sulfurtransferase FdhD [Candidatus Eisenbacteria bacterium]
MVEERTIIRWVDGGCETHVDTLVSEARVTIAVNGEEAAALMALPAELEELAVGFLFAECAFAVPGEVAEIRSNQRLHAVYVTLSTPPPKLPDIVRTFTSGCGRGISRVSPLWAEYFPVIRQEGLHRLPEVLAAVGELTHRSTLFRRTGGVHTAGLWMDGGFRWVCDDIGRHNAVDKVIGHALRTQWPPSDDAMLVSTGRLSTDIVLKSIRAGVPLIVSRSAPTAGAVHLAETHGLTLVGFARAGRCNVYTHHHRVQAG